MAGALSSGKKPHGSKGVSASLASGGPTQWAVNDCGELVSTDDPTAGRCRLPVRSQTRK